MSEPRIGRVLVASLHQAIADLLPTRLEFYENWLNISGLREGTIGLAPLSAVLSFLRTEGDAYELITSRAGEYAAEWTAAQLRGDTARFGRRHAGGGPWWCVRRDDRILGPSRSSSEVQIPRLAALARDDSTRCARSG